MRFGIDMIQQSCDSTVAIQQDTIQQDTIQQTRFNRHDSTRHDSTDMIQQVYSAPSSLDCPSGNGPIPHIYQKINFGKEPWCKLRCRTKLTIKLPLSKLDHILNLTNSHLQT